MFAKQFQRARAANKGLATAVSFFTNNSSRRTFSTTAATFDSVSQQQALSLVQTVEFQTRILKLKRSVQQDGRSHIPVSEFLKLVQEQVGVGAEEAKQLLKKFNDAGVFLNVTSYNNDLQQVVITKPELLAQELFFKADAIQLQPVMQQIVDKLADLNAQLAPLAAEKAVIDAKAVSTVKTYFTGAIFYLMLQMGYVLKKQQKIVLVVIVMLVVVYLFVSIFQFQSLCKVDLA